MGIRYALRKATQSLRFSSIVPACGNDWTTVFMIHKRELSDSMIESGSSLFYLLHCSAHDRLNTMTFRSFRNIPHGLHRGATGTTCSANSFVSAHPTRIASVTCLSPFICAPLCLSTSRTDCITEGKYAERIARSLPQHIPHGLHLRQWTQKGGAFMLCLSTSHTDCISRDRSHAHQNRPLPQHIPHGLHPARY